MQAQQASGFWQRTPRAARPAVIAATVVLVLGLGTFVVVTGMASISLGVSPTTAVFGPGPGNPLIVWLYFAVPTIVLQAAVALGLRHRSMALRVAGTLGAFVIGGVCLVWLLAVALDLITWLATGRLSGDVLDMLGVLLFVPVALLLGFLNARAGLLTARALAGERREGLHPDHP